MRVVVCENAEVVLFGLVIRLITGIWTYLWAPQFELALRERKSR
jgi:hypothetical protein